MRIKKVFKVIFVCVFLILLIGFLFPEKLVIPVKDATDKDWNHTTFWFEPWGRSGVHKGIDIFAAKGTPVISASYGAVIYKGELNIGGKVIAILGPKWRIHYYAHLNDLNDAAGRLVMSNEQIAAVGDSGNAKGKPPHLHYSILSLVPYSWRWDDSTQGWKKMFFMNPSEKLLVQ
jgi:murein DD-endopeptidase MepM/ murein hydrolase activator NlpD